MRKLVLALSAAILTSPAGISAQQVETFEPAAPLSIQLDGIPTSALVVMLMRDVMRVPYVISPDVLSDRRPTSVRLIIPRNEIPQRVVAYLRQAGFVVQLQAGTVYVSRTASAATADPFADTVPSGSPLAQPPAYSGMDPANLNAAAELEKEDALAAYVPAHREPAYFAQVLSPLFPAVSFGAREGAEADSSAQMIAGRSGPDILMLAGPLTELVKVELALAQLDRPRPMVAVKAVVMQVSDSRQRGSALSILASIAGGRLEAGSGSLNALAGSQFVRLSTGALSAVLSAVRDDSRFQVIASPNLSALSGSVATINAGSQVPTVGSVIVSEGIASQSVVYRDSGITLQVRPTVRGGLIELDVRQERSNFVPTTNGVDNSPTLQTASVSAQAIIAPGESIVLAGLTENSEGHRREGFFGGLIGARSRDKAESELVVMLQAELVPLGEVIPAELVWLSGGPLDVEVEEEETDALS